LCGQNVHGVSRPATLTPTLVTAATHFQRLRKSSTNSELVRCLDIVRQVSRIGLQKKASQYQCSVCAPNGSSLCGQTDPTWPLPRFDLLGPSQRSLCQITKCSQFEYTFCRLELRVVKPTAAANGNSNQRAVDATAASFSQGEMCSVCRVEASLDRLNCPQTPRNDRKNAPSVSPGKSTARRRR
jgi:hypothetical protein